MADKSVGPSLDDFFDWDDGEYLDERHWDDPDDEYDQFDCCPYCWDDDLPDHEHCPVCGKD